MVRPHCGMCREDRKETLFGIEKRKKIENNLKRIFKEKPGWRC